MSHDDLEHYRDNLRYVVRPEAPADRQNADRVRVRDYEALYLYDGLVEYAAYEASDAEEEGIALAYAEYIHMVVRDEGRNQVHLYAHSETAQQILADALDARSSQRDGLHATLAGKFIEAFGDD